MDRIEKREPADQKTLEMVLHSVDQALEGLARCCNLSSGFGPNIFKNGEVLSELLKDAAYREAYEKCKNGEIEVSGGFISDINIKTMNKEELLKKYSKEINKK
jgi:hypothetical protein